MGYHQITPAADAAQASSCALNAAIARLMGRHRSTICRELARNSAQCDRACRPSKAQERTNGRRSRSRRTSRFSAADWKLVSELLREGLSPEQISGRLGLERRLEISHESRNDRYRPTRGRSSGHWEMDTIVSSADRHCVVSLINV